MNKINQFYTEYNEDARLRKNKASSIEFLTTNHFIELCLNPGMKILDIGAGTGVYSIYYAQKGYSVTAVDLVEKHINFIKAKTKPEYNLQVYQENAMDLSRFSDGEFDIVLCLGPLYHLRSKEDKIRCIKEAIRVCKKGGQIFFGYISNDMVFITENFVYEKGFLSSDSYDRFTFYVYDNIFYYMTISEMILLMESTPTKKVFHFAADGLSELLAAQINLFTPEEFELWYKFHLHSCCKEEMLGCSNHIVYVAEKI